MLKSQNLKHILTVQVILLPKTTKKLQNLIQKNQKQNQRICPHKAPVTMKLNSPNRPRHSEGSQQAHHPPPSYIDVIVALKPPLSSLVEVSPALLIPIQQPAVAGQLLNFFRLSLGTPSRSFLRLSCSDSPLPSSSGDLAHHLFTLLVPCLLLLIHPKSNPTLLLELVIEVILRLL